MFSLFFAKLRDRVELTQKIKLHVRASESENPIVFDRRGERIIPRLRPVFRKTGTHRIEMGVQKQSFSDLFVHQRIAQDADDVELPLGNVVK